MEIVKLILKFVLIIVSSLLISCSLMRYLDVKNVNKDLVNEIAASFFLGFLGTLILLTVKF